MSTTYIIPTSANNTSLINTPSTTTKSPFHYNNKLQSQQQSQSQSQQQQKSITTEIINTTITNPIKQIEEVTSKTSKNLENSFFNIFDICIYYIMNLVLLFMVFIDLILEFGNNCIYNYNIIVCSFKHKLYNNIN